jgi:hypothetical protein
VSGFVRRLGASHRHHCATRPASPARPRSRRKPRREWQPVNPALGKALLPSPHCRPAHVDPVRHLLHRCRSAEARTICARSMCLRGRFRSAEIAANCSRSATLNTTHTCCALAAAPNATGQYCTSSRLVTLLNESEH